MKKILLLSAAMCGAFVMNAMEAPAPEELAKYTAQFNNYVGGGFELSSAVGIEYPDASNTNLISINNFNGTGNKLTVVVDWENGTLSVAPQNIESDYDYDTYQTYYYQIVSEEASKLSSPMDKAYMDSRVTGTITENTLKIDNWYLVKIPGTFNSLEVASPEAIVTEVRKPNALMTFCQRYINWDIENDDWIYPVEDGETMSFSVYVDVQPEKIKVYNWDDLPSCCEFTLNNNDGVFTYSNNAEDIVYSDGKRFYSLYSFKAEIDTDVPTESTPLVSEPVTDPKQLDFGYWVLYSKERDRIRTMGAWAKLTFDEPLPVQTTSVSAIGADEPVSTVYYNLQGLRVDNPSNGVFVKVTTTASGVAKATKVQK